MATANASTNYLERRILHYIFKNNSLSFASPGDSIYVGLATAVSAAETGSVTDASSSGNILFVGALDASKVIASGDIFRINAGNLTIELK